MEASQQPKIKAIIFDMDGVLINSEKWWDEVEGEFFRSLLKQKWTKDDQKELTGRSLKDIYALVHGKTGLSMPFSVFAAHYDDMAHEIYAKRASLMPGALTTLDALAEERFTLALASSSRRSWIQTVMSRFDLQDYFVLIASAEDVGDRGKPAPDLYLYTSEKISTPPHECLVVEDSTNGVLAGKAAGMRVIGYRTPFNEHHDLSTADGIITDLRAITTKL